jgi:hypothetical protein
MMCAMSVVAFAENDSTASVETSVVETEIAERDIIKELKEVLIILAESSTKGEAVDKIMAMNLNATAGEALDVVEGFVEMAEYWDCRECVLYDLEEGLDYGLEAEWIEWYLDTYFPDLPESCEIEEETDELLIGSVAEDVVNGNISITDAIVFVSSKLGISVTDAEYLIEKAIEAGDLVLEGKEGWELFKIEIENNREFWTVVALCIISIFTIIFGVIMFILEVKKPVERMEIGTERAHNNSKVMMDKNSQTLENISVQVSDTLNKLEKKVDESLEEDKLLKAELEDKNKKITELEVTNEELKRGLLDVGMYTLQMLELIYSRTNLPLSDRSLLDLWKARAEATIKSRMTAEDLSKHEEMTTLLGGDSNEEM